MTSVILALCWHCLAAGTVLVAALMVAEPSPASLSARDAIALGAMALGYLCSAMLIAFLRGRARISLTMLTLAAFLLVYGLAAALLFVAHAPIGPRTLIVSVVCALLLYALSRRSERFRVAGLVVLTVAVAGSVWFGLKDDLRAIATRLRGTPAAQTTYLSTVLYKVKATFDRRVIVPHIFTVAGRAKTQVWWGGAVAQLGQHFLLVSGDGRMFLFDWDDGDQPLQLKELATTVPINVDEFARDAVPGVVVRTFRVADVLVQTEGDRYRVFVSHHTWDSVHRCSVLRVSYIEGTEAEFSATEPLTSWRTLYETQPCLPFKDRAVKFGGLQNGGIMSLLDEDTLLLTVGDHEFDGYYGPFAVSQDKSNSYGKTVRISIATGAHGFFTIGHRNPEGLAVDRHGNVWMTEHGPKGGDELNLLVAGGNYGWPLATFGTAYDKTSWPPAGDNLQHDSFIRPLFAWLPSIGVSDLTRLHGPEFGLWKDDILIGALTDRSLWRLRILEGRVIYAEPAKIGCRIRDILQTADGRLILWCDNASTLVFLSEPDTNDNGELLFAQCEGCHSLDNRTQAGIGPDLRGVGRRRIASKPGFHYSDALDSLSHRSWSADELDAFLEAPQEFAPGTTMDFAGIDDQRQRRAIVEYLLSVK